MTVEKLQSIYNLLLNEEYSVEQIVEQTGLTEKVVRLELTRLKKGGYITNGVDPPPPIGERRFTTKV